MSYRKTLHVAKRTLVDGATLAELKQASRDLRALAPRSALADLVDAKIKSIESRYGYPRVADPNAD